ncbi:MAG: phosphate ABC transporter substrate-binding protein PstS [Candidatus Omnitrophica bacterium]|nr:phosphate ABC transporter substrate-binding protein PstS [Candidatus Omnitrophota bacterium]MDE2231466.1 phosphate ABC transporter substrate-binding protein PstS [Candidatus Omnitrophota bacterium]
MKKLLAFIAAMAVSASAWAGQIQITGAGSTFIYPAITKWFEVYSTIDPNIQFNYQAIGSGAGIKQITAKTVDFGGTDGPMTEAQMAAAPGKIYHIPLVMGAEAIAYNIPGIGPGLKFTPDVLAGIWLGEITNWNDPKITAQNPGVNLPNMPILVAHRSDGSGTTFIFTHYLSSVSSEWASKVGYSTSVSWPVGLGGKGNQGVSGILTQNPGAIGYVELAYAIQNKIPYGVVENSSGNFVQPTVEATSQAASGVPIPADFRASIVNSSNPQAYPICGFSWMLIYKNMMGEGAKGKAMVDFAKWAVTDGQKYSQQLDYAPLPSDLIAKIIKTLDKISY